MNTVQPADTPLPSPFGWCHHTHSISARNSAQCNQQTLHHHLRSDGVTIHTAYQLATQHTQFCQHISSQLSTHNSVNISARNSARTVLSTYQLATQHSATSRHSQLSARNSQLATQHTQFCQHFTP
jgi:hypothetical protein